MRNELGPLIDGLHLAHLFPNRGQPAERAWRLALITVFQFVENFPTPSRLMLCGVEWIGAIAMGLELENPGFDHTALSEFRSRLVRNGAEGLLLDVFLEQFSQQMAA